MTKKIHDIFSYPLKRNVFDPLFLKNYLKNVDMYSTLDYFFRFFPFSLIRKLADIEIDYIFLGAKHGYFASQLPTKNIIFLEQFSKNSISLHKDNNLRLPINYYVYMLAKTFRCDPMLETAKSKKLMKSGAKLFSIFKPKALVVSNDSLFLNRFMVHCAKEANVLTICIQDGIFQSTSHSDIFHGKYADYMFVWSEHQRNILVSHGVNISQLKILGYTGKIPKVGNVENKISKKTVCIFGQPWERFSKDLGIKKKNIFDQVCKTLGAYEVVYKPHPGEKEKEYFPDNILLFQGTMAEALSNFQCFISLTSTALIEATLAKKVAIQIYDESFSCDNFEKVGFSYAIDSSLIESIQVYIEENTRPFSISSDVIFIETDIEKKFDELLLNCN